MIISVKAARRPGVGRFDDASAFEDLFTEDNAMQIFNTDERQESGMDFPGAFYIACPVSFI
jgi:hypothetical protein